jgi:hypothetical protein
VTHPCLDPAETFEAVIRVRLSTTTQPADPDTVVEALTDALAAITVLAYTVEVVDVLSPYPVTHGRV